MLRSSLRTARLLRTSPAAAAAAGRQWSIAASRPASAAGIRYFADQRPSTTGTSTTPTTPTNSTTNASTAKTAPVAAPATPAAGAQASKPVSTSASAPSASSSSIKAEKPKTQTQTQTQTPAAPPPPRKRGFFRRLRNFFLTLILLGVGGFAGGVWYSRVNDNFHDFFTEYIPFGEQAVLYLEELEFKKRFPNARTSVAGSRESGEKVRIPVQSGASWRVADQTESVGRRSSAATSALASSHSSPSAKEPAAKPAPKAEEAVPKPAPAPAPFAAAKAAEETVVAAAQKPNKAPARKLKSIDLMSVPDAKEPIVRDLVHMINDLILVINADEAHGKYGSSVEKAKSEIVRIGSRLNDLKTGIEKQAASEVKATIAEFDAAAADLIKRVENTMVQQEVAFRQEFEEQMKAVRDGYDQRVALLLEREQQLGEERLRNKLTEQAVALKKEFLREVEARVEEERESRLGKIDALSAAVAELEKLSLGWNKVVDSNLRTQQLHVAVEAVRARLEDGTNPGPFIRELVAIKEIASDDALVDAAIASITPSAYQRGISTPSQLIDRFRRVAGEVRKASLLPDDAGVASHASSWALSHIMFKKQGLAEGDDVESILTRTHTFLEEGDLDAAAREMTGLQGWAKTLSKDWLAEARKVLEVQQALDVIATEARLQSLRVD
ncbi:Formation of crista junctions protein 1 [Escovopsis weberi]|uniref:MICOS complex subunit MIC60 n=1 Tax=Escovopsis weberi TaxID=150374 RepID=A0A0M8N3I1_ESCWE|nr:Formation of crista junctions protein 1 [Escovopsis weberi]